MGGKGEEGEEWVGEKGGVREREGRGVGGRGEEGQRGEEGVERRGGEREEGERGRSGW